MLLTAWCAQRTGEVNWATTLLACPAHERERRNHFRSTSEYLEKILVQEPLSSASAAFPANFWPSKKRRLFTLIALYG